MKKLLKIFFIISLITSMSYAEVNQAKLRKLLLYSLKIKKYMYLKNKKKVQFFAKKFEQLKEELEKQGNLLNEVTDPNLLQYLGLSYISSEFLFYSGRKKANYELGLKFLQKSVEQGNLNSLCYIYDIEKKLNYPKPMLDEVKTKIIKNGLEEKCKKLIDKF